MTLRKRTFLTIVLTLICLMSLLHLVLSGMLFDKFASLEGRQMRRDMHRVVNALEHDLHELSRTAEDWGAWDETRHFVQGTNDAFVSDKLRKETFVNSRLNLVLFANSSHQIVFGRSFDLEHQRPGSIPQNLSGYLTTHPELLQHSDPRDSSAGVILLPEAPLLVAICPISSSRYESVAGTLIIGRYLTPHEVERLSALTDIHLNVYRLDDPQMPTHGKTALAALLGNAPFFLQSLRSQEVASYTVYKDIVDQPALLLVTTSPCIVGMNSLLLALLVAGLVFSLVTMLIIEKLFLSRLAHLSAAIDQVRSSGNLATRLTVTGNDELSNLSDAINRMLMALEKSYQRQQHLIEQLNYQVHHDVLTGLANRVDLEQRIQQVILQAQQPGGWPAVIFIDIDRFKLINDTLGHHSGDRVIQQVVQRFRSCIHPDDLFVRMGGDEFVIVVYHLRHHQQMAQMAQRLLDTLQAPLAFDGYEVFVTASIGISIYPGDGQDSTTLLRHADNALHYAKQRGKNSYAFFSERLHIATLDHLALENDLHRACASGELELYYQPQVDLLTGAIVGVEALVRWNHPRRGLLSPGNFIPLAEESGLIVPIGRWVLQQVCRQNVIWQQSGYPPIRISVNVSAAQFYQARFAHMVVSITEESELDPRWLELEITESLMMHDSENVVNELTHLRALGITIALDDFGTGYSSLAYIQNLPIDVIKIDQSFVQAIDVPDSQSTQASMNIIRVTTMLAHSFGLRVVAEGMETIQQYDHLRTAGCDVGQGYLFGRPLPSTVLGELLEAQIPQVVLGQYTTV